MPRTFVGFGFGPIQSGLFLYEAWRSGNFTRFVVAEVDGGLVAAVRANGGRCTVNIARRDGVESVLLEGIELCDPNVPADRGRLVDAIAESHEMATALPSVAFYDAGGGASVARLLAEGLARRSMPHPAVLYAAENHNHAADLLLEALRRHAPASVLEGFQPLDTVIGKMSGVIAGEETIRELGLAPIAPGLSRAVLVEEFNRILVSRVRLPGFSRGIACFEEKDDLLPFEEAKLYGHNAIHATIAYLAAWRGLRTVAEASSHPDIMAVARRAFLEESGAALIARHASLGDPLFTREGFQAYADDLLQRMVNPFLHDLVERVTRDPLRKLGRDDRFFGTMRIALQGGIAPRNLALGAAAAVRHVAAPGEPASVQIAREAVKAALRRAWGGRSDPHDAALVDLVLDAMRQLEMGFIGDLTLAVSEACGPTLDGLLASLSHARTNALTGETVLVSPRRLERPWQGLVEPPGPRVLPVHDPACYLCPGNMRAGGHRNPDYSGTFVFDNDFPALDWTIWRQEPGPYELLAREAVWGLCRVVCHSPRHDLTLAEMDHAAVRGIVEAWTTESAALAALPMMVCVQVFENKGEQMGCSNPHPHGQVWATSTVPFEHAREDERQREWFSRTGRTLLGDYLDVELCERERIVCENDTWVCLVPWWAKWPFETLVVPRRPAATLEALLDSERDGLADILRRTAVRYDNLFATSFPYTMGIHQAPLAALGAPHWHLHVHFYPPLLRSASVRKFMVGFEMLAMPQRDFTPEAAAERLRAQSEHHYRTTQ